MITLLIIIAGLFLFWKVVIPWILIKKILEPSSEIGFFTSGMTSKLITPLGGGDAKIQRFLYPRGEGFFINDPSDTVNYRSDLPKFRIYDTETTADGTILVILEYAGATASKTFPISRTESYFESLGYNIFMYPILERLEVKKPNLAIGKLYENPVKLCDSGTPSTPIVGKYQLSVVIHRIKVVTTIFVESMTAEADMTVIFYYRMRNPHTFATADDPMNVFLGFCLQAFNSFVRNQTVREIASLKDEVGANIDAFTESLLAKNEIETTTGLAPTGVQVEDIGLGGQAKTDQERIRASRVDIEVAKNKALAEKETALGIAAMRTAQTCDPDGKPSKPRTIVSVAKELSGLKVLGGKASNALFNFDDTSEESSKKDERKP